MNLEFKTKVTKGNFSSSNTRLFWINTILKSFQYSFYTFHMYIGTEVTILKDGINPYRFIITN